MRLGRAHINGHEIAQLAGHREKEGHTPFIWCWHIIHKWIINFVKNSSVRTDEKVWEWGWEKMRKYSLRDRQIFTYYEMPCVFARGYLSRPPPVLAGMSVTQTRDQPLRTNMEEYFCWIRQSKCWSRKNPCMGEKCGGQTWCFHG